MAEKRQFRAGSKNTKYRNGARMSENRIAWVRTVTVNMGIMRYEPGHQEDEDEYENPEPGPTYRLIVAKGAFRPVNIHLTGLTEAELECTYELIKMAFDLARPIVLERDRKADEAYANGDDSFSRSYRQLPQFVVREGAFGEDGQGVLQRLASSITRRWRRDDTSAGVRGRSGGLADEEPADSSPQDDREEVDQPEGVRQVGEVGADAERLQRADSPEG